jgi:hypothetical protein
MNTGSLLAWKQQLANRRARATDRREHHNVVRDPRLAMEHYSSRQDAIERGEPDSTYFS